MPQQIYLFIVCVISAQWLIKSAIKILQLSLVRMNTEVCLLLHHKKAD